MMKRFSGTILGILLVILLSSWGWVGHSIISDKAAQSFNSEMELFSSWAQYLKDHASDADKRKATDPNEGCKHYIDIDNYSEFISNGTIPPTLEEAINAHGQSNVYRWGILPYATRATFDSLVSALSSRRWEAAKTFAADLGHYVGDGHMPLHLTANYNGQLTDNYGIHSRYESTMVGDHADALASYPGHSITEITDVTEYILDYLYSTYRYKDSILFADNHAKAIDSQYGTAYYNNLWDQTGSFTRTLFDQASHSLAELLYTAWINAGKPSITASNIMQADNYSLTVTPNPATTRITVCFRVSHTVPVELALYSIGGIRSVILANGTFGPGAYTLSQDISSIPNGAYIVVLRTDNASKTQKLIVSRHSR